MLCLSRYRIATVIYAVIDDCFVAPYVHISVHLSGVKVHSHRATGFMYFMTLRTVLVAIGSDGVYGILIMDVDFYLAC